MQAALSPLNPSLIPEVPGLYLSDISIPSSIEHLQHYNITHVLSILSTSSARPIPPSLNISHKIIELDDDPYADLLSNLEPACDFIHTALRPPEPAHAPSSIPSHNVLVHCTQGISRSASIAIAYIMRTFNLEYTDALAIVRAARSVVFPNQGFVEQLVLWRQMGYTVRDGAGDEKVGYERWKERVGDVGEGERIVGMRMGVGRLAAMIGRRRMGVECVDEGEEKRGNGGLVRQAEEEIGNGVTRVKDVLEKRRVERERQKLETKEENKEKKRRWEWEWGGE